MAKVELSSKESHTIDKAIRLLRDRHYRNYYNAKDQTSETAIAQRHLADQLDQLRNRITSDVYNG